jgi:ABC-type branched-subunit amino acid transport system ATPase component/predicted MFS family arabinose efflux permease
VVTPRVAGGSSSLDELVASLVVDGNAGETETVDAAAPAVALGLDAAARETDAPSLWPTVARVGALPLVILTALNFVDEIDRVAMVTLAPDIKKTFGLADAALGAIVGLSGLVVVLAALPLAVYADRRRRVPVVGIAALVWSAFAFVTGLATSTVSLVLARLGSGLGKGSIEPVHTSLLADYYPVDIRGRVLAVHRAAVPLAAVAAPVVVGGIAALAGGSSGWRWAFFAAAPLTVIPAVIAFRLREPARGAQEDETLAVPVPAPDSSFPAVPFATAVRRLLDIRSLRYMYFGIGVLGFGIVGAPVLISRYLEDVWHLQEVGRGVFFSIGAVGLFVGLLPGGKLGDRLFRRDPSWPLHVLGFAVPAYTALIVVSLYMPTLALVLAGWILAGFVLGLALPAFLQLVAATAPPAFRSLAFSLFGIFLYVFGGFFGPTVLGGISDATSPRTALSLIALPGLVAGILLVRGARFVGADLEMVRADLAEMRAAATLRGGAGGANIIEIRNLDFFYGSTQVLFGVNLDIPEGEIVALLGTNGAGKSTVLRVLTGLDHPRRGQVRLRGGEITYLEAEQILALGITQMPGGRAVFPALTVDENLRVGTFSFRHDRARVADDLEQVFRWFPLLHDRRHQVASTLSGGEQQMLGLAKAFLTRPQLLCIDELSLGLAPAVTAALLDIVREIHARGTTVVIVEQSLNVALSLATTAVFMEKGEVRFAGPAGELRGRRDLARSVFIGNVLAPDGRGKGR